MISFMSSPGVIDRCDRNLGSVLIWGVMHLTYPNLGERQPLSFLRQAGVLISVLVIGFGFLDPAFAHNIIRSAEPGFTPTPLAIGISNAPDAPQFWVAFGTSTSEAAIKIGDRRIESGSEYRYIAKGFSHYEATLSVPDGRHRSAWAQMLRHENSTRNVEYGGFGGSFVHNNKLGTNGRSFIASNFEVVNDQRGPMGRVKFITSEVQSGARNGPQGERKKCNSNGADGCQGTGVIVEGNRLTFDQKINAGKGAALFLIGLIGMFVSYAALIRR